MSNELTNNNTETSLYIGERVISDDGYYGTIRYEGSVDGFEGIWYGINWDNDSRGKHRGTVKGKQYFICRDGSASFMKREKLRKGKSLLSSLTKYYTQSIEYNKDELYVMTDCNNKLPIEFVGMEKMREWQKNLSSMRIISADNLEISEIDTYPLIYNQLQNLEELNLTQNLLNNWNQIIELVIQLPLLERLILSDNRLMLNNSSNEFKEYTNRYRHQLDNHSKLTTLVLNRMKLPTSSSSKCWWSDLKTICKSLFRKLEILRIAENDIVSIDSNTNGNNNGRKLDTEELWKKHCFATTFLDPSYTLDQGLTWRKLYKELEKQYEEKTKKTGEALRKIYNSAANGLSSLIIIGLLYIVLSPKKPTPQQIDNNNDVNNNNNNEIVVENNNTPAGGNRRGGLSRMNTTRNRRTGATVNNDNNNNNNNNITVSPQQQQQPTNNNNDSDSDDSIDSDDDDDDINLPTTSTSGKKIGTKKLEKLKKKAEMKKYREYEQHMREEKKKKEEEQEELLKQKREENAERERLRKEEEERIKLEKERKEDEEYNLLKGAIQLEDSGETKLDEDSEKSLLQEFISYLQTNKICLLEDIAMEFNLKTNDVIERIKTLDKDGLISGVIDDRGKFIYITKEEMESVAKFINKKGRISIEHIAQESNRLIDLNKKIIIDTTTSSSPTEQETN
eukprot:gene11252-13786_t